MASYDNIIKGFHRDIEQLQDTVDGKNLELRLIESDMQESLKPSILGSQISCTVAEMLMEILEFEKSKGKSARTETSKKRLIELLNKTEQLNTMSTQVNTMKLINRELHANYQLLRIENMKLKSAIQVTEKTYNEL